MAEKLMHLPTKPTAIHAEGKKSFVRRQHYQPNEKEDGDGRVKREDVGKEGEKVRGIVPSALIKPLISKGMIGSGGEAVPLGRSMMPSGESGMKFEITPQSERLSNAEKSMVDSLPRHISDKNGLSSVSEGNTNGVYRFMSDSGEDTYYQKPSQEEGKAFKNVDNEFLRAAAKAMGVKEGVISDTISGNLGGREILAYEDSKMLGVEELVPPTLDYQHQMGFGEDGLYNGPAQMSVQDFSKKHLRHDGVTGVADLLDQMEQNDQRRIMDRASNATDMVVFDFITGNGDRHGANYFVSRTKTGEQHLIANDNGMSYPEHAGDMIHPDWRNSFSLQHDYYQTDGVNRSIGDKFLAGILDHDEQKFRDLADKHGISKVAQDGRVQRLNLVKDMIKQKYVGAMEKYKDTEQESVEARREAFKKEISFTGKDLEKLITDNMLNPTRSDGSSKYTKESMGSGNQTARDQMQQISQIFKKD